MNIDDLTTLIREHGAGLSHIIDLLPAPIYMKDIRGRYIGCNSAFAEIWGAYKPADLIGKTLVDFSEHPIAADLHQRDLTLLKNLGCRIDEVDVSAMIGRHAIMHFHSCATLSDDGSANGLLGIVFDITARAELEHKLEALSQVDELTQAPNRRHAMARLEALTSHSKRHNFEFGLLMLDIDFFKGINDKYGHKAGDDALRQVSAILAEMIRTSDTVFRYGGEEFVILLPNTDIEGAQTLAGRFRNAIANQSFALKKDLPVQLTVSIGIANFPRHGDSLATLFSAADAALYEAKNAGRNCCRLAAASDSNE